jgi:hypothetical protein
MDRESKMQRGVESEQKRLLQFYWEEALDGEDASSAWGQLAGSTHRLMYVANQLEALGADADINTAVTGLAYHLENYLVRTYELRDRVLTFLVAHGVPDKVVQRLRHPSSRENAMAEIRALRPALAEPLGRLLQMINEDIKLRNDHTHGYHLRLGLVTPAGVFDPEDALLDFSSDPQARAHLEGILRSEIALAVEEYRGQIDQIWRATWDMLKLSEKALWAAIQMASD